MSEFVLYRNTKDRTEFEKESDAMDQMETDSEIIDFAEFAANCDYAQVAADLRYDDDLKLEDDWHVSYSKSKYGGLDCFILGHSECDFIFLKPDDAKMLQQAFAQGMTPMEWKRRTEVGTDHMVDPR